MTHFGSSERAPEQLHEVGARLDDWAALARVSSEEAFIAAVQEQIAATAATSWRSPTSRPPRPSSCTPA